MPFGSAKHLDLLSTAPRNSVAYGRVVGPDAFINSFAPLTIRSH